MHGRDKHSSLLRTLVNYDRKKFCIVGTWSSYSESSSSLTRDVLVTFVGSASDVGGDVGEASVTTGETTPSGKKVF
jgi:hypothetical protein